MDLVTTPFIILLSREWPVSMVQIVDLPLDANLTEDTLGAGAQYVRVNPASLGVVRAFNPSSDGHTVNCVVINGIPTENTMVELSLPNVPS